MINIHICYLEKYYEYDIIPLSFEYIFIIINAFFAYLLWNF